LVHPKLEFMHDEIPTELLVTQFQGDLSLTSLSNCLAVGAVGAVGTV